MDELQSFDQIMPKSLDDIIRKQRDTHSLRLSTAEDFVDLPPIVAMMNNPKQVRTTINEWRIVCLVKPSGKMHFLTGINEARGTYWMTSTLKSVDFVNNLVLTENSIYRLGSKGEGAPNLHILLHLCSCFHSWGFGDFLGAPHIFY